MVSLMQFWIIFLHNIILLQFVIFHSFNVLNTVSSHECFCNLFNVVFELNVEIIACFFLQTILYWPECGLTTAAVLHPSLLAPPWPDWNGEMQWALGVLCLLSLNTYFSSPFADEHLCCPYQWEMLWWERWGRVNVRGSHREVSAFPVSGLAVTCGSPGYVCAKGQVALGPGVLFFFFLWEPTKWEMPTAMDCSCPAKPICWSPDPQCGAVWRRDLWGWFSPESGASVTESVAF